MQKKRYQFLDDAKAYLIVLVVLGHVLIVMNPGYQNLYLGLLQEFISAFHMAAFFMIHGILFNNTRWKEETFVVFLKNRFRALLIPYLFFEFLGILIRFLLFKQSIVTGIYHMVTIRCNVGADWFLLAMFLGSLLFFTYVKHSNKIYAILTIMFSIVFVMFVIKNQFLVIIGRGLLAYVFIILGNLLRDFLLKEKNRSMTWLLISFLLTGMVAVCNLKFGGNDFYTCTIRNPMSLIIGGCSGTWMILGVSSLLRNRWISLIGQHTLTIMGTHQLCIYVMTALLPEMYGKIGMGGVLLLVILVIEIPVVYIIDYHFPFLIGRK